MQEWAEKVIIGVLTFLGTGAGASLLYLARKGARADIIEDAERKWKAYIADLERRADEAENKQDKRHEQNSDKLDRLTDGISAVLVSQATQAGNINMIRESQAQMEKRVTAVEGRLAELERSVRVNGNK